MLSPRAINLAGKDFFTVPEAAEYAGISLSQWRSKVQPEFPPGRFKGKLIYRRSDVQRYIEANTRWPRQAQFEPNYDLPLLHQRGRKKTPA